MIRLLFGVLFAVFCFAAFAPQEAGAQSGQVRCRDAVLTIPNQRPQIVFEDQAMCQRFAEPYRDMLRGDCLDNMCRGAASRIANLNEDLETTDIILVGFISPTILYRCSPDASITETTIPTPDIRMATLVNRTVRMPAGAVIGTVHCPTP